MKRQIKLTSLEHQQLTGVQQTRQDMPTEFANVEEMLRHDALHTPVPPAIAHRLEESLAQSPPTRRGWWRRLLGS
ncbi:MAG: hypothetical protein QOJ40_1102 [Verrucomicrobiota bacterium]